MTTGELLSYHSSLSSVSALDHLRHIIVNDQYVDHEVAELQEELFIAEIVDTGMGVEIIEVFEAVLIDESLETVLIEEISEGVIQ